METPIKCPWNVTVLTQIKVQPVGSSALPSLWDEVKSDWLLQVFNSEGFRISTSYYATREGEKNLCNCEDEFPQRKKDPTPQLVSIPWPIKFLGDLVCHQSCAVMCYLLEFFKFFFLTHLFRAIFCPHKRHFRDSSLSSEKQQFSTASFQPGMGGTEEPHWWPRKVNKNIQYQELCFQQLLYPRPQEIIEPYFPVIETLRLNTL